METYQAKMLPLIEINLTATKITFYEQTEKQYRGTDVVHSQLRNLRCDLAEGCKQTPKVYLVTNVIQATCTTTEIQNFKGLP